MVSTGCTELLGEKFVNQSSGGGQGTHGGSLVLHWYGLTREIRRYTPRIDIRCTGTVYLIKTMNWRYKSLNEVLIQFEVNFVLISKRNGNTIDGKLRRKCNSHMCLMCSLYVARGRRRSNTASFASVCASGPAAGLYWAGQPSWIRFPFFFLFLFLFI
jgi:hypothetical protein